MLKEEIERRMSDSRYMSCFNSLLLSRLRPDNVDGDGRSYALVTVMFERNAIGDRSAERLKAFSVFYNDVCRRVLGKNHHRASFAFKKPLAVACIDAEGSRYANRLVEPRNIHIHSVWSYEPGQSDEIERCLSCPADDLLARLEVLTLDFKRLSEGADLEKAIAYSTKLIARNHKKLQYAQDFEVFPKGERVVPWHEEA